MSRTPQSAVRAIVTFKGVNCLRKAGKSLQNQLRPHVGHVKSGNFGGKKA